MATCHFGFFELHLVNGKLLPSSLELLVQPWLVVLVQGEHGLNTHESIITL